MFCVPCEEGRGFHHLRRASYPFPPWRLRDHARHYLVFKQKSMSLHEKQLKIVKTSCFCAYQCCHDARGSGRPCHHPYRPWNPYDHHHHGRHCASHHPPKIPTKTSYVILSLYSGSKKCLLSARANIFLNYYTSIFLANIFLIANIFLLPWFRCGGQHPCRRHDRYASRRHRQAVDNKIHKN